VKIEPDSDSMINYPHVDMPTIGIFHFINLPGNVSFWSRLLFLPQMFLTCYS